MIKIIAVNYTTLYEDHILLLQKLFKLNVNDLNINQKKHLIGKLVLVLVISKELKVCPQKLRFKKGKYGKPSLANISKISYSLSYTGSWVFLAVSNCGKIGLDAEEEKEIDINVASEFCSKREFNALTSVSSNKIYEMFYKIWTLKESYLKFTGRGLSSSLKRTRFDIGTNKVIFYINNKLIKIQNFKIFKYERVIVSLCYKDGHPPRMIKSFKSLDLFINTYNLN